MSNISYITQVETLRLPRSVSATSTEDHSKLESSSAELAWQQLCNFEKWPSWMPDVKMVRVLDENPVGRGTTLVVETHNSKKVWAINCWNAPKKLEFTIESENEDLAYGFGISLNTQENELEILLNVESSYRGFLRHLAPILIWKQKRYSRRLLNSFVQQLQSSTG